MIMEKQPDTDVLVIGSGIAGLSAAIYAAKNGTRVTLSASVNLFSGSTFFPGTWGFGLVGPENEKDEKDLIETIERLGQGVTSKHLVETFVRNLNESVDLLEKMGITLEKPSEEAKGQKEYIPCFDHKHRRWRGLTKKNLLETLPKILKDLGIRLLPDFEVIELLKEGERVTGAVGIREGKTMERIQAKAVILATGGLGGLYSYKLTTDDVNGSGVGLALRAGASAINMEFMQIMLGFVKPGFKTVHNEKTFFASQFHTKEGRNLLEERLPEGLTQEEVLRARSLHGPFSSETVSRYLDLSVHEEITKNNLPGVPMTYDLEKLKEPAEFVKTYFRWLKEEKHVSMEEEILIAPFMHASNGGLFISEEAKTPVPGLFAAGECTGGMHGADRIGGLSTANGIVFGKIAGEKAALYCSTIEETETKESDLLFRLQTTEEPAEKLKEMRKIMYQHAFLKLEEESIRYARNSWEEIHFEEMNIGQEKETMGIKEPEIKHIRDSYRLLNGKAAASALLTVQLMRKESRGSFYRSDYPVKDEAHFRMPLMVRLTEKKNEKMEERLFEVMVEKPGREEEIKW
ncbi:FAD-binding protein [Proteiniclasticum sp. SCR006]|uniref:FAD-binding protein n=1 Tax=Proteiniclasticum aestuarii TaxID=2817862 RepID=A0A939HBY0_9CLOT|nr:FAD-binding protein [Proteiniclasticum aestuarii]MBO1265151.1 FAD-binding protein [Proteiniclasticum aestuarii]